MNRYVRLGIIACVWVGTFSLGAYEGTRYGYDNGIAQGTEKGIQQGRNQVTDEVVKTCEANADVLLILKGNKYFCFTESQFADLVQAIAERAIEQFRKQEWHHGQEKPVSGA